MSWPPSLARSDLDSTGCTARLPNRLKIKKAAQCAIVQTAQKRSKEICAPCNHQQRTLGRRLQVPLVHQWRRDVDCRRIQHPGLVRMLRVRGDRDRIQHLEMKQQTSASRPGRAQSPASANTGKYGRKKLKPLAAGPPRGHPAPPGRPRQGLSGRLDRGESARPAAAAQRGGSQAPMRQSPPPCWPGPPQAPPRRPLGG